MGLAEKSGHAELEECAQKAKHLRAEKQRKEKKKPHGKRKEAPKAGAASAGAGASRRRRGAAAAADAEAQAYRNRARSRAPPPKSADDELMARNRALFEDKTFFVVVAWGWFDAAPRDVTVAPADVEAPPEDGYRGDPNVACWSSFNATSADRGGYDWQKIVCAKLDDLSDTDSEKQTSALGATDSCRPERRGSSARDRVEASAIATARRRARMKDDFVAHASQIAYPFGGAPAWAEEGLRTFWTHSPDAMRSLQDAHVFNWTLQYDMEGRAFPDYYGADSRRGADRTLEGYVADGVEERADGSVVVTASALGGGPGVVVEAARGVVFATGGKIRGLGAAKNNHGLEAAVVGTCASPDSKGAALDALEDLPGVAVVNKGNSWMYEVDATGANTIWFLWASYNQRGEFHVDRVVDDDGEHGEDAADSSQLFLVYGDAAKATYSYLIDSPDTVATNVSFAATDVEAASWFGYDSLHADFGANLRATLDDFNAAAAGDGDDPMGRGAPARRLRFPFANDGASTRLYVRPLNFGSIDTKMGPKADKDMKVAARPRSTPRATRPRAFGQTYAAPGNTLGFALVSGYVAARRGPPRTRSPTRLSARRRGYRKLPESGAHQVLHLAYHNDTENVVVARSYGGFPWEGVMPAPLAVACDAGGCAADLPEGLWVVGFEGGAAEKPRAAATRWIEQMALPATLHRDYFRKRATPLMTETCDAGEAGADETLGAKYSWWYNRNFDGQSGVEVRYDSRNGKGMVFTNIALDAEDQLRQRMAWALSHIYVVAVDGVGEANEEIEVWLKYYDIFVEHALATCADVLRDIAASPMMAVYLTFLGSEQYQGGDAFPDENFAREFLQLFTIGLREMNDDGTFTGYETYDGDDILTGARAWTGFDVPKLRGGMEAFRNENFIDDLDLVASRRDPFPKSDLAGGYVGDGVPLCVDVSPTDAGAVFTYVGRPATSFATKRVAVVEDRRRGATAVYEYAPPRRQPRVVREPEAAIWEDQYGLCADPRAPFWDGTAALPREGACALGVQIASSGAVNVVHANGGGGDGTAWWLGVDSNRLFRVPWEDGAFPTADADDCGADCLRLGVTCLCPATAVASAAFAAIPSRTDALDKLKIGSPVGNPADHAVYAFYGEVDGVAAFSRSDGIDVDTIFVLDDAVGNKAYLKNVVATVQVAGGYSFRNAPHFVPFAGSPSKQAARFETEAFIDGVFEHPNVAPFVAKLLLQRFSTSNPSPRYVAAVVDAFRTGSYAGFGTGQYGDLAATLAAILLDREATSPALLADPTHGRLREPLLKVLHFMRAMELDSLDGREVELEGMDRKIGQMVHEAPSVFSYYLPDYAPQGAVARRGLVAPEAQVMEGARLIGLANGLYSLIRHGLSRCDRGFGGGTGNCNRWPADGGLAYAPPVPDRTKQCSREVDQRDYRGSIAKTRSGLTCQRWDSQKPHQHKHTPDAAPDWLAGHNFCRQPKSGKNRARAWCFTTEKKTKWDYCDVPRCDASFVDAVDDLDVLLTEGRLSDHSRAVILDAVDKPMLGGPNARLQLAQRLFTLAPEFHATNAHEPVGARDDEVYSDPPTRKYKAVVLLFLNGGADSYTMLAPTGDCAVAGDYVDYRGAIAEMPFEMSEYRSIAPGSDQPCDTFGVHPSLEKIHGLYEDGDASFFANIGSLVEPLTLAEYRSGAKRTPPSIGAHDVQQRLAQTVVSDNMSAKGVLGRISAPSRTRRFSRLIDYDELKEEIGLLLQNESSSVFADTFAGLFGPAIRHAEEISGIFEGDDGMVTDFPDTGLGRRFEDVARIVTKRDALEHERAAFFVEIGGFDNHGTLDALPMRLEEIDDAVAAFADEMKAQGIFEDVAIVTMSDFGRTLTWNGAGTDHGWGGHHFIIGGGLNNSTIHGRYPETLGPDGDLNYSPDRGRIIPSWASARTSSTSSSRIAELPDLLEIGDVFHVGPTAAPSPTPSHAPTVSHAPTTSPTPAPTLEPTVSHADAGRRRRADRLTPSFVPTATFAPTEQHVCEGIPGVRAYKGGRLHCIELNGELVDFFPVKGGERTCRHTDENSCPAGFDLWVPRNIEHAKLGLDRFSYESTGTVGRVAMNSHDQRAWEALDADNVGFTSVAGEGAPWFMRNEPFNEPNGNYDAGCWLTTHWDEGWEEGVGFRLDDANCARCSVDYVCSTNRVAGFGPSRAPTTSKPSSPPSAEPSARPTISPVPSAAPTTSEPSPSPTPEPSAEPTVSPIPTAIPTARPTLDGVCPEAGVFEYGEHTLHCFFIGGDEQDDDAGALMFGAEQAGFCVKENYQDVNSGVVRLRGGNFKTAAEHLECLELCGAYAGATGCEAIWGQGNSGCYVHTSHEIAKGNGQARHSCWLATGKFKAATEGGAAEASAVKATPAPSPRELVDIVPVESGAWTCKRTDENSCPLGMDIWARRSVLWP
ncbi:hypothetical protein JL721_1759 [Aureococcus anophagefferens]|nr:hypothetical protein JL721_1759 [Aureococcus anophagefferens]